MIRHELGVRAVWSNNAADRVGDAIDLPMWRPSRSLPMQTLHQARSMATFFELKRLWLWIFGRYGRSFCLRYWNKPHSLVVMDTKRVAGRWSQVLCYTVGGSKTHMVPRYVCLGSMGHQEPFFSSLWKKLCVYYVYESSIQRWNTLLEPQMVLQWSWEAHGSIFMGTQSIQCANVMVSSSYIHVTLTW